MLSQLQDHAINVIGKVLFLVFPLSNKVLFYNIQPTTVKIGTVFIKARCTIFEIAIDLNITIFPSIVKSLILHTFKIFFFLLQAFYCKKSGFPEL